MERDLKMMRHQPQGDPLLLRDVLLRIEGTLDPSLLAAGAAKRPIIDIFVASERGRAVPLGRQGGRV